MIKLQNIGLEIANRRIIENISFELKRGEITTLIGPNGGGKTSIAKITLGILKPSCGEIIKQQKIKIGYMPQKIEIDPTIPLTVGNFILLGLQQNSSQKIAEKLQNNHWLAKLGINDISAQQMHQLSGGQMQKVLLLRCLLQNPDLLILDEPTQYMDVEAIADFYRIIEELRVSQNCAIMLISHDLHMVMNKTDFVLCINNHICCQGKPEEVHKHPQYLSLFSRQNKPLAIYQHQH